MMTPFVQKIVTKKLQTLRIGTLIVLCGLIFALSQPGANVPAEGDDVALPLHGLTVAVDPGHGGYDGGARAQDSGRWEKEITLEIALKLQQALESRGARVILTRTEDVCLAQGDTANKLRKRADLQKRLDIAKEYGADVFLSIHLNEYRDRSESGPHVFYQKGGDQGRLLAGFLQEAMVAGLNPTRIRKAQAGDYYVLRGELPSALIECGFLSNPQEEALLLTPSYQTQIARSIANGLQQWYAFAPMEQAQ